MSQIGIIIILLGLSPAILSAGNPGREAIVYDISKRHYKYYRGEYPLGKGNHYFALSIGYLESGGDLYGLTRDNMARFGTNFRYGRFIKDNISLGLAANYSINSHGGDQYKFFGIGPQLSAFYEHDNIFGFPFLRIGPLFTSRSGNGNLSGWWRDIRRNRCLSTP